MNAMANGTIFPERTVPQQYWSHSYSAKWKSPNQPLQSFLGHTTAVHISLDSDNIIEKKYTGIWMTVFAQSV